MRFNSLMGLRFPEQDRTAAAFAVITVTALIIVAAMSIYSYATLPSKADDSGATAEGVNEVVGGNNEFAFDLYSELNKGEDNNIFFSPYSMSTAVAIAYEGAEGETEQEMQDVFHFPEDQNTMRSSFARIFNTLNKGSSKYILHTANALWAQEDYAFLEEYTDAVERYYGAEATNVDFVGDTESVRLRINHWVESQTNNKIENLLTPGSINPITSLVITNAVYFKGDWANKFDKRDTKVEDFTTAGGEVVQADMMRLRDDDIDFNYAETDALQILEMPYKGEELSMLIILPKDDSGDGLGDVEVTLDADELENLKSRFKEEEVHIYMPKFTFETKYSMADTLSDMGMPTAFTWPGADFSGMDGTHILYISKVVHQAFVEVNEEGTEAAAATGIVMTMGAAPSQYKVFRADHPFIFIIQEKNTGSILFMGRIVDPTF